MTSTDSGSSRRLAILSAFGSRGDVNPMISIGRQLKTLGYDVAISLAEPYAPIAEAAGLQTYSLVDHDRFHEMLSDPSMWKMLRGMRRVIQGIAAGFLEPHFDVIRSLHRPGQTVLVAHPLDFAARIFRDHDPTTPLVNVHLAPVMLRNPKQPPRLTPWPLEPTRHRLTFSMSYWFGDTFVLDPMLAGPINRIRRTLGLERVRRVMNRWWHSPDRILACYPDWFAPATVDLLPQLRHVGFPLDDGTDESFERPVDRPVVFTGGSANWHTRGFFDKAADACRELQLGGLLLGSNPECFPKRLPATVRPLGYTPLGKLLPHCRAIVHHGGIGTTSQALRAGVPQIVRPMAFDQFDNADRVSELKCGVCLQRDRALASKLSDVLNDASMTETARSVASRLREGSGSARAAAEIDAVMTDRTAQL